VVVSSHDHYGDVEDQLQAYRHPGGPVTLTIRASGEAGVDNSSVDITASVEQITLKRNVSGPRNVGNPLAPGDTIMLSAKDCPINSGLYVVSPIGAAANSHKITANYNP
jgi:hypothetical protein